MHQNEILSCNNISNKCPIFRTTATTTDEEDVRKVENEMVINLHDIREAATSSSSSQSQFYKNGNNSSSKVDILLLENKTLRFMNNKLNYSIRNLIDAAEELITSNYTDDKDEIKNNDKSPSLGSSLFKVFYNQYDQQQQRKDEDQMLTKLHSIRESLVTVSLSSFGNIESLDVDKITSENLIFKTLNDKLSKSIRHLVRCIEELMQA